MKIRFLVACVLLAGLALLPTGCAWTAKKPLDVLYYTCDPVKAQPNLFVFMRGMGGSHRSFEEEGLVDDVRSLGLPFDMAAPNAHLGYYTGRTLCVRLKADVIDPARRQGKQNIWAVGFSMGGLGALLYLLEYPGDVDGVCLVAPFLGDADILEEIEAAGGVRAWTPGAYDPNDDWQRMLWHWIKENVGPDAPVPIYLAYGEQDRFAAAHALLAPLLPPERVVQIPGGHDYETFKALWDRFLQSGIYRPRQKG